MPKPYPKEFREDVVRVARNRGPGVTLEQVAADFGVRNFPQAYRPIGVIGSALLLQQLGSGTTAAKADVLLAVGV
ncbi:hypothetical protein [Streptomyces sp. NPDC005125]